MAAVCVQDGSRQDGFGQLVTSANNSNSENSCGHVTSHVGSPLSGRTWGDEPAASGASGHVKEWLFNGGAEDMASNCDIAREA